MGEQRSVVDEMRFELPRQARTKSLTGLEVGAGHAERGAKRTDVTIEDMKENMTKIVTFKHKRAIPETLDASWVELCAAA
eukprot:3104629-Prymnesium_polylepis.1